MNSKLISVIVPVYNVKRYIGDCLESILGQTYKNLQVILIDDGSTDGSDKICEEYANKDERILFIRQQNMGVAKTRKKAMHIATGDFVGFVDSDDYIDSKFYEILVDNIEDDDLITSGYYLMGDKIVSKLDGIQCGRYASEEEMDYIYSNMICMGDSSLRGLTPYMWDKLYRRDLAQDIFEDINDELFLAEDSDFLYRYVLNSKSICILDFCGYYYRVREDSTVRSINCEYLKNISDLYLSLKLEFEKYPQRDRLLYQLEKWISGMIASSTKMMGFHLDNQLLIYGCSMIDQISNKRVVLYGAGQVGKAYYRQIKRNEDCNLVLWVDKDWEKNKDKRVEAPQKVVDVEFDLLVIAIKRQELAEEITKELLGMGIQKEKIIWKKPIEMLA